MKKQNAFTIADDIFLDALEVIHNYFSDIPYAIVGGGAVQLYVSSVAVRQARLNSIKEINGLSFILRQTGDIDLSFDWNVEELIKKFNMIIELGHESYIFHNFVKRFVLQKGTIRFNLNYQTGTEDLKGISDYYFDIIHSAITVEIPYKRRKLKLKMARPEYLVVSKLTRVKPKDQIDISLILKSAAMDNYPFDTEEVRSILKSVQKEDNYDILLELMDNV